MSDPENLSPVHARSERLRPQVSQPSSPWTLVVGLGGAGLLGLIVFTTLSNGREAKAETAPIRVATAEAPPAQFQAGLNALAQNQAPPPAPVPMAAQPPPAAPQPASPDLPEIHWRAPAVVVDLADAASAPTLELAQAQAPGPRAGAANDTARASQMRDLGRIVPQGFVIPATLETAIDSDLPGSVRAVVSRDVRGFDGAQVLIPRGSKLIGQYRSAAAIGQTRAFVVWTRIITPTGVTIDVGSPATDTLGRGGLAGTADDHFFQRFGAAILLSVVSGGVDALARSGSNNIALVIGSPAQAQNVASIALQKQIDIPTTIRVPQGKPVQVSVARDLDFTGVR